MNPHHLRTIRRKILRQLRFPVLLLPFAVIHLNLATPRPNIMLTTIKTNWRDIAVFLLIGLGLVILSGLIDYVSGWLGFRLILPAISNYLQGFSRFVGANIAASLIGVALWPTVNRFANERFADAWRALTIQQHFFVYLGLFAVELLAGAVCFIP